MEINQDIEQIWNFVLYGTFVGLEWGMAHHNEEEPQGDKTVDIFEYLGDCLQKEEWDVFCMVSENPELETAWGKKSIILYKPDI